MAKKHSADKSNGKSARHLSDSVKGSAQHIWQAGLGALSKAQAEGSKALESLESLVKEGVNMQRKTQTAAEEKISEATHKMTHMASDITSKAAGQWDRLENIFEDRVAKALNKLGVPSAKDINALIARIDALNQSVQALATRPSSAAAKTSVATKKTPVLAKKAAAKHMKPTPTATKKVASKAQPTIKPRAKTGA